MKRTLLDWNNYLNPSSEQVGFSFDSSDGLAP